MDMVFEAQWASFFCPKKHPVEILFVSWGTNDMFPLLLSTRCRDNKKGIVELPARNPLPITMDSPKSLIGSVYFATVH